ncbi:MAG: class I adenylate-forming enzyme family protein [Wenzhouxiangellaceae bacterium]
MKPWLAQRLASTPDSTALLHHDRKLSWRQLASAAAHNAGLLQTAGIQPGHTVALRLGSNALENVCWLHALWWHGAVPLPLGSDLPESCIESRIESLSRLTPGWIETVKGPGPGNLLNLQAGTLQSGGRHLELAEAGSGRPIVAAELPADHPASVILTSGSSSVPKAVPMTITQHQASVAAVTRRLDLHAQDEWLCCLPLEHVGGLAILIRAVITGAAVRLHDRFQPDRIALELRRHPVTRLSLVPTMLGDLLDSCPDRLDNKLSSVLVGGAACAPDKLHEARERGLPVLPTWGMTEAGSQLATPSPAEAGLADFQHHPGWVGPPLPGVEVRTGPDHRLQVRGPMLFSGYWKIDCRAPDCGDPAPSGPDRDGWFTTDDRGRIDDRGHLYILGRIGASVISGGVNVSLTDVERRLLASGLVRDLAMAAVDDERWGQRLAAIFVPRPGATAGMLKNWSQAHLAPAERPVRWLQVERLPRTSAGKLSDGELQNLLRS